MTRRLGDLNRKANTTETILNLVAVAGVISIALLAPNCVQLLAPLLKRKRSRYKYYVNERLKKLEKGGLIKIKIDGEDALVSLTDRGERELERYKVKHELKISKRKWDGKWRIVMFDIRELNRRQRDYLRVELISYGLIRLQNSVWVTPYDCADLIGLLKTDLGLDREVIFVTAENIENDTWLRKEFKLK